VAFTAKNSSPELIGATIAFERIHNYSPLRGRFFSEEDYLNSKPNGIGKKIFELLKEKVLIIDSSIV
jgi:hypothetical protein